MVEPITEKCNVFIFIIAVGLIFYLLQQYNITSSKLFNTSNLFNTSKKFIINHYCLLIIGTIFVYFFTDIFVDEQKTIIDTNKIYIKKNLNKFI